MKNQLMRISIFYCSNSLQNYEIDRLNEKIQDIKIDTVSLPCSGKINLPYLLKAIETGSDGVLLASCRLGNCNYLQGNFRAQKRVEYVDDLLSETGFGREHVKFVSLENENKLDTLLSAITEMAETLRLQFREV
jgi:coenzyme F420-reducing hydrogenase delta subunit